MIHFEKAGLFTLRAGNVLLCRKKHSTSLLILPGGCLEPGESIAQCLDRELREELGDVRVCGPRYLGTYEHAAAGDPEKTVRILLYGGDLIGDPVASSEIAELVWFRQLDDRAELAPSLSQNIFPDLISRGILPWPA